MTKTRLVPERNCVKCTCECWKLLRIAMLIIYKLNIKHEREQSLFWHWVWSEMGKPYNGVVYDLMKRSRHTYHYSVRRVKKNKINIQKQRLADTLYDNTNF